MQGVCQKGKLFLCFWLLAAILAHCKKTLLFQAVTRQFVFSLLFQVVKSKKRFKGSISRFNALYFPPLTWPLLLFKSF